MLADPIAAAGAAGKGTGNHRSSLGTIRAMRVWTLHNRRCRGTAPVQADNSSAHDRKALVLVVEREPHVRVLERFFLEKAGFSVEFCDDGAQALERAKSVRPDILISEILVPRLDGLAVCRAIKSAPETSHIIVVIFSILAAADRARVAGADAFLRKPLNDSALIATVGNLLAKRDQKTPPASKGVDDGSR